MGKIKIMINILIAILCVGCSSKKDIAILQNMEENMIMTLKPMKEIILQENDLIKITVTCAHAELAIPFNKHCEGIEIKADGNVKGVDNGYVKNVEGYRIDINGYIDFPVLGKFRIAGMYLPQVEDVIRQKLIEGNYLIDPTVKAELTNFKYTVLGAVATTGQQIADGNKVTILDALAKAGDISARGDASRVSVIRTIDGKVFREKLDIRDQNIFSSSYFYLQPNDIVYVEPRYRDQEDSSKRMQYTSLIVSICSILCSLIWALK